MIPHIKVLFVNMDDSEQAIVAAWLHANRYEFESVWANAQAPMVLDSYTTRMGGTPEAINYPTNPTADPMLYMFQLLRKLHNGELAVRLDPLADVVLVFIRGSGWAYGGQDGGIGRGIAKLGDEFIDAIQGRSTGWVQGFTYGLSGSALQERLRQYVLGVISHEVWHALGSPGGQPSLQYHTNSQDPDFGFEDWDYPNLKLEVMFDWKVLTAMQALRLTS